MRFGRDGKFTHYRVRGFYFSAEAAPVQTITADGRHVVVVNFFDTREAADEHAARCVRNAVSYDDKDRAAEKARRKRAKE
jgi:uncharacterized protein YfaP (DUF2135 family)